MRALIDTCIIIDALQNREEFCDDALKIFLAVANKWFVGFFSAESVTDIYYLTHHYTHSDKDIRAVLNTLFQLFELIDTAGMDCRRAISSDISNHEDAVMVESAVRSRVDCIVTRNIKDYHQAPIPMYLPSDFLRLIEL